MSILRKTLLCTSSILLVSAIANVESSQAAIVTESFTVNIDFGLLTGNTYSGSYSYDDSGLTGEFFESADLTDFSFTFVAGADGSTSTDYDLGDLDTIFPATADFESGTFLGITLNDDVDDLDFSFLSGFIGLEDAEFFYDLGLNGIGSGDFQLSSTTPIPTPALLPSLIGMGIAEFRRKRNLKKDTEEA